MKNKKYAVRFSNSSVGSDAERIKQLRDFLTDLHATHGENLPSIQLENDHFQVRNLTKVGEVWHGAFAHLRDDAPMVVDTADREHLIEMEDGDRILEKSFFIYRERSDILIYQFCKGVGGLSRFQSYWGRLLDEYVALPVAVDTVKLEEFMARGIYELDFTYARPPIAEHAQADWSQSAFNMLRSVHGAQGSFVLRATKKGSLGGSVLDAVKWLAGGTGEVKRARVKLTDEQEPIDLFMSPVKDKITVPMSGRYPCEKETLEQLEAAYDRQAHRIPEQRRRRR